MRMRGTCFGAAFVVCLGVCGTASTAMAESGMGFELSAGYTRVEFDDAGFNTAHIRGGLLLSRHFGVEVEGAFGIDNTTTDVAGTPIEAKLNWSAGGFGVLTLPVGRDWDLFARAGYVSAEAEADAGFGSVSDRQDGYGLGVGVKYFPWDGNNGIRLDYTRYQFGGDGANAFGISYVRSF